MNKRIFVTATNTNIGKTHTAKSILREFASRGLRVGAIKLIETGVEGSAPDAESLLSVLKELNPEFRDVVLEEVLPISYSLGASPFVASGNAPLDLEKLDAAVENLEKLCDVLIMEGAGGLYVPIDEERMMIDLISHFKANALLVTHCSLGCVNDTLLSEKALREYGLKYATAFNCRENEESFKEISQPYFSKTRKQVLKVDYDIDTICDVLYNL
jgi:dethiobiotin synthetase